MGKENRRGIAASSFFRRGSRAFFMYGFAKSKRANIDDHEREQFKKAAAHVLGLPEKLLTELLNRGDFIEVKCQ
jgi:hypothetical protein